MSSAQVHPLSEFQRDTESYIRKVRETGEAAILTVDGEPEVVLQSASAYRESLADRELIEDLRGISRGLDQAKSGQGRPMRDLLREIADRHGIRLA